MIFSLNGNANRVCRCIYPAMDSVHVVYYDGALLRAAVVPRHTGPWTTIHLQRWESWI